MNLKKKLSILGLVSMMIFSTTGCQKKEAIDLGKKPVVETEVKEDINKEDITLLVYSGAGLKKPMTEIAEVFEENTGVKIEYVFAGSTQLLSQIELTGKGDVFIVGAINAYNAAEEKDLVNDYETVAYHNPIIGVPKGNPAGIEKLEDLAKDGVRVILGDEEANAIGKTSQKIFEKLGLQNINENVVAKTATVNELLIHLTSGDADAAIITEDSAFANEEIDLINIPEEENIPQILPIGTLKMSEYEDVASEFVSFVSSDAGKKIFESYGFPSVK